MINYKFKNWKLIAAIFAILIVANLQADDKHFLWEVSDGNNKLYLLGSIHVARADLYPLSPIIMDAFERSEAIALEINIKNVNHLELLQRMMISDGSTLKDLVSEDTYNILKEHFSKHSLPEILYESLKPSATVTLLTQIELATEGFSAEDGIDLFFLNKAEERNLPIYELESVELQLEMFDVFDKYSDAYVNYSIEQMNSSIQQVEKMFEAWKLGDTQKMLDIIDTEEAHPDFEKIMEALLDNRNIGMTEKIEQFLQKGEKVFVIVGAAHLIGENSIIEILENTEKYQIKQL